MRVLERVKYFWTNTLGVDCPDEPEITDSELKESLEKSVKEIEEKFTSRTVSNKTGKGGKGKGSIEKVEVKVNEAIEKASEKAEQDNSKETAEREIGE